MTIQTEMKNSNRTRKNIVNCYVWKSDCENFFKLKKKRTQIENLKKELESSNELLQKTKKNYEEQINNHLVKEKVFI